MAQAPSLHSLLDEALAQTPDLSRFVLNAVQDAMEGKSQSFLLTDAWRRLRPRFAADLSATLLPLLEASRRGDDPLHRPASSLDTLSLVDETQALKDVAIAHVIHTIEDQSKPELHQLGNFFAALRGTARARQNDNPLRPALFAQALHQALFGIELDAQLRYQLMQMAATPMAKGLHRIYTGLCAELRAAELTSLVSSHAARRQDADTQLRIAEARQRQQAHQPERTQAATLDGLARRVDARNSRPQALDEPRFVPVAAPDMLSRLYDQILADPRLLPPVKASLARLQIAVVRLARSDASLLRKSDHPTWLLLNRVAAHGMAFERSDDAQLQAFLRLMADETQQLVDAPAPSAALFAQALQRVDAHIGQQARQRGERSAGALAGLEREQNRGQWLPLVREQIEVQIGTAALGPRLRHFLQTVWADVIVQAMVKSGHDAPEANAAIDWVDGLLDSLQTPADENQRAALRQRLPLLIAGLRAGCDSIALPESEREPVMQELMQQHGRLLRNQVAPTPPTVVKAPESSHAELLQRLLTDRESQLPEHWAHTRVDRGQLPTVPVQLYAEQDSPAAAAAVQHWLQSLAVGNWYHLFIQSEWMTAQLAWISETGLFLLFVGQNADERHSVTRGALEKLLANGLIAALDDTGVVQRAVDTLMKKLDDER